MLLIIKWQSVNPEDGIGYYTVIFTNSPIYSIHNSLCTKWGIHLCAFWAFLVMKEHGTVHVCTCVRVLFLHQNSTEHARLWEHIWITPAECLILHYVRVHNSVQFLFVNALWKNRAPRVEGMVSTHSQVSSQKGRKCVDPVALRHVRHC